MTVEQREALPGRSQFHNPRNVPPYADGPFVGSERSDERRSIGNGASFAGVRGMRGRRLSGACRGVSVVLAVCALEALAGINFNMQDAEILGLIRILSEQTGKTFVPDEKLASVKVTVVSSREVGQAEAMRIFEAILRLNGFAMVEQGNMVKIVSARDAKSEGMPTLVARESRRRGDSFVTQVIFLRYAAAESLVNILRPLVSVNGHVVAENGSNAIILTDGGANVRRFLGLVEALDVEGAQRQVRVFSLRHSGAESLARILSTLLDQQSMGRSGRRLSGSKGGVALSLGAGGVKVIIVPDPRTNVLLASGTAEQLGLVERLLGELDVKETIERTSLHVYTLKNANAEALAKILTAHVKSALRPGPQSGSKAREGKPKSAVVVGQFESKVTVTADPATNSLVIGATPEDYRVVRDVVERLDVRRRQVFVQALMLEASASATQKLGVELRFTGDPADPGLAPIGGTTFPVGSDPSVVGQVIQNPLSPPGGLVVGAVDGTISFNGVEFLNIAGLARALQSDSGFNVLSMPHTTTLDNEESEIVVGEERPFLRSQQSTDVGTLVSNYDFKDIGIKLKFTPHISVGGTVRLELSVEITNFVAEAQGTVGAVTTTKRSVSTSILVETGQMAVIGGLMQEQLDRASSRVPCLGSVPVVGWLFKSSSKSRRKTNLLIFIEPRILPDRQSLEELRREKQKEFDDSKPQPKGIGKEIKGIIQQLEVRPPS